jgi:glycine C-acetyltransferase
MITTVRKSLQGELESIEEAGLIKRERVITSPQDARIQVGGSKEVLNFCANNYLGLANHPKLIESAHAALDERGFGLASVRFICGTQDIHKQLEERIAEFLGMEASILYASCFDANGGLFEVLLGAEDAIVSDELNHASIIDGIRLCKAKRYRYKHLDMADLDAQLKQARADGARRIMIATDGVFSMDGDIAPLEGICDLAENHDAMVMVDDCHATGFIGKTGRGTWEHCGVGGRVDIITSTLGKALGGATGGFTAAKKEVVELLRQRSRPYLFSNSVAPTLVAASITCLEMLSQTTELRDRLEGNTIRFREGMSAAGFAIRPGVTPIVPIMLGDARLSMEMADALLGEGIYVIGFSYPVVPKGKARIRVQLSAAHRAEDVEHAIEAFTKIGKRLGVI